MIGINYAFLKTGCAMQKNYVALCLTPHISRMTFVIERSERKNMNYDVLSSVSISYPCFPCIIHFSVVCSHNKTSPIVFCHLETTTTWGSLHYFSAGSQNRWLISMFSFLHSISRGSIAVRLYYNNVRKAQENHWPC